MASATLSPARPICERCGGWLYRDWDRKARLRHLTCLQCGNIGELIDRKGRHFPTGRAPSARERNGDQRKAWSHADRYQGYQGPACRPYEASR